MEEARRVLERLERIERLERRHAPSNELLGELHALVREAEAWVRVEAASGQAQGAVERCRSALAQEETPEEMPLTS